MFVQRENHAGAPHLIHEHVVEQERQGIHDSVIAPYLTVVDVATLCGRLSKGSCIDKSLDVTARSDRSDSIDSLI